MWPANEGFYRFKMVRPEPGYPAEGTLRVAVKRPATRLWEYVYGPYHFIRIRDGMDLYTLATSEAELAARTLIKKLVPVNNVHFDHEDIIRRIADENVDGVAAQCIYFTTVAGDTQYSNKICVDAARGWPIYRQVGEIVIKESAFYQFNNGWLPGHVERWTGDTKIAEVEADVSTAPAGFISPCLLRPASRRRSHTGL